MKTALRRIVAMWGVLAAHCALAQISIPNTTPVTENFDGMAATLNLPANWRVAATATPTWGAGATTVGVQASSGSPTAGNTYNWGSTAGERAVGSMTSGSFASPRSVMAHYQNNNAGAITQLAVSYDIERYRRNSAAASVQVYYSTDGSTWTAVPAGDVAAASLPTGTSVYSFNPPNLTVNVASFDITGLSIANGGAIYLRWNLNTTGASSQGIGVDNVSVTATFAAATPAVTLADNGAQIAAGNVLAGATAHVLHTFSLAVATADATLQQINFTTAGTHDANDLTNLKLRYSTDNTLDGGDATLATINSPGVAGAQSFTTLSQSITAGNTGYLFITADVDGAATVGNTVSVDAIGTADLTFASGTKSGSTTAGGAQTVVSTPNDVTMATANGESAMISSIENDATISTTSDGAPAWDVLFNNPAGDAGAATISALTFTQGAGNEAADWTTTIRAAGLFNGSTLLGAGTIGASSIAFSGLSQVVSDNDSETLTLRLSLQNTATLTDGDNLEFALTSADVTVAGNGVTTASIDSDESQNRVQVTATELVLSGVPSTVTANEDFGLTVTAQDANANTDTDSSASVTLSKASGTGSLTAVGGLTQNLSTGVYSWSDLRFDTAGPFTILADDGGALTDPTSGTITAQALTLLDTFGDGDFTASPVWSGDTARWTIQANSDVAAGTTGSQTLRMNGQAVIETDHLRTQIASWGTSQEWGLWVGRRAQAFTAANQMYIWLYANEANLESGTVDGYRLAIGDDSGGDNIRLERIDNGVATAVITSSGALNNGLTDIGFLIRVTRSNTGDWELFTSTLPTANGTGDVATAVPSSANASVSQGTATDATHTPSASGYFGVGGLHSAGGSAIVANEFDQIYFTAAGVAVPDIALADNAPQVVAGNVNAGATDQVLYKLQAAVTTADATLTAVNFTSAGTYAASDVTAFRVWYSADASFGGDTQLGTDITTALGAGIHGVSGFSQNITAGNTGYLFITADIAGGATPGNTLNVQAMVAGDLIFNSGNKTGTPTAGGAQTIQLVTPTIALADNGTQVTAANVNAGAVAHVLHTFQVGVTVANATLNQVDFTTAGTHVGADLTNLKLRYSVDNTLDGGDATLGTLVASLDPGAKSFTGLSQLVTSGSTGYFFITADIAAFPTDGNTLNVNAIGTADLTFAAGSKSGSTTAGGVQTITVPTPSIVLADNGAQVSAATVNSGLPNIVLHRFQSAVTVVDATLNQVDFDTAGTYVGADLTNLKLRYSTDAMLDSADATLGTLVASLGPGAQSFTALSQTITAGSTGYFFITADIATAGVIAGGTLNVQALAPADLTFAVGTPSGSTTAGGVQTLNVPAVAFRETMGNATASIAAHEAANGFDNDAFTMTDGDAANPADIRTTNPSSTYTDPAGNSASTQGNVYFTTVSGDYGFAIEDIDASGYSNLELSFGYRKESAGVNSSFVVEWSDDDGATWYPVSVTSLPADSAATGWYLVPGLTLPAGAQVSNLRIRWVRSGGTSMRLDDVLLRGDVLTPVIALADNGTQVAAGNVYQGAVDHVLHTFQVGVTVANTTLNQVDFTTAGTYVAADLTNLKLRYSTDNTLDGGDATLGTLAAALGPGAKSFTGLTQAITAGNTGYFFITADVPLSATAGNTIHVQAIGTGDLTFVSGSKSGSTTAGGAQTVVASPNDLTMTSASGESATITSIENAAAISTTADGVQVWQVTFNNPAGNAGAATISALTFDQGAGNEPADWTATIRAAGLFDGVTLLDAGTINATTIDFSGFSAVVADSGSKTLTLRLSLVDTDTLTDGDHLEFALANGDVTVAGNSVITASVDSDEAQNAIAVVATELVFSGVPANVGVGQNFGLTLTAEDANGNTDSDDAAAVTLSLGSGSGVLSSTAGLAQSLVAGVYTWNDLQMDSAGSFTVRATSVYPQVDTASITAAVVTKQLLDDFNRANSTTVGNGWTESESGAGASALQVNANRMEAYHAGTAASGREFLNQDVSSLYATTYANASEPLEWVFNMRQGRATPGGWGGGSYASAFILGSSAVDPQNGNGSGYAVIIGESGAADTIRLVRFATGLNGDTDWTAIVSQSPAPTLNNYFSIRVTFDPTTGTWELFTRDDGAAAFADPASGTLTSRGTAVNTTHTSLDLRYLGAFHNHGSAAASAANGAVFDEIYAPTAVATVPSIALANNAPQVTAASVNAGTVDHVLHRFQLGATVANATLTAVDFTSAGTYVASDVTAFRVWFSTDAVLDGGDTQLGADITTGLGAGSHGVSSLSQAINAGDTGYVFITVDIAALPTAGNTIHVNAITTSDVTFSAAVKSGSTTAGGAQTMTAAVNDGDGTAAVLNQDGTVLDGTDIFRRTLGGQVVEVTVTGVAVGTLEGVEVDLPAGWSGLALGNVTLSGAGFGGGTASTPDGDTIRVTGAALTDVNTGVITISGLTARDSTGVTDDGDDVWTVRTRKAAGTFTAIASSPLARITIPIENIRDVDGNGVPADNTDEVAVEGVSTFGSELATTTTQAYIQDATAGVLIFNATPSLITANRRYVVYGDVIHFNGLTELQPPGAASDVYDLGPDTVTPVAKTLTEILTDPEGLEGTLVEVSNLSITAGTWPVSGDASLTVSDDCGTTFLTLRIDNDTGIDGQPEPAAPFSVVAAASQFDNSSPYTTGYQIIPRSYADFTAGVALTAPVANAGLNPSTTNFLASWSAVAGATEYRLDVSTSATFTVAGQVAGSNAYHNGTLGAGTPGGWTETSTGNELFQAAGYLGMTGATAVVISPAMDFNSSSAEQLNFQARTFAGVNPANNIITVSVSVNDGLNWTVLGTRTPASATMTAMAPFDLSGYSGTQVKVKFETLGAGPGARGAGIDEIMVNAQVAGIVSSYVTGYADLQVLGTSVTVTGLDSDRVYYYRVRAGTCAAVTGPDSNTATVTTAGPTVFMFR